MEGWRHLTAEQRGALGSMSTERARGADSHAYVYEGRLQLVRKRRLGLGMRDQPMLALCVTVAAGGTDRRLLVLLLFRLLGRSRDGVPDACSPRPARIVEVGSVRALSSEVQTQHANGIVVAGVDGKRYTLVAETAAAAALWFDVLSARDSPVAGNAEAGAGAGAGARASRRGAQGAVAAETLERRERFSSLSDQQRREHSPPSLLQSRAAARASSARSQAAAGAAAQVHPGGTWRMTVSGRKSVADFVLVACAILLFALSPTWLRWAPWTLLATLVSGLATELPALLWKLFTAVENPAAGTTAGMLLAAGTETWLYGVVFKPSWSWIVVVTAPLGCLAGAYFTLFFLSTLQLSFPATYAKAGRPLRGVALVALLEGRACTCCGPGSSSSSSSSSAPPKWQAASSSCAKAPPPRWRSPT